MARSPDRVSGDGRGVARSGDRATTKNPSLALFEVARFCWHRDDLRVLNAEGVQHVSPGRRPGKELQAKPTLALKGRYKRIQVERECFALAGLPIWFSLVPQGVALG